MFKRLPNIIRKSVTFYFDGEPIEALEGDTIASALLSAGYIDFRKSALSDNDRGPYCLMGSCFECLLEVDGVHQQQTCLIEVKNEMRVSREETKRSINNDA